MVVEAVFPKPAVFVPKAPVAVPPPKVPVVPKAPVPAGFAPKRPPPALAVVVPNALCWGCCGWPNAPVEPNADVVFCCGWPNALVVVPAPNRPAEKLEVSKEREGKKSGESSTACGSSTKA